MTTGRSRVLTQVRGYWQQRCAPVIDNTTRGVVWCAFSAHNNEPYSQRLYARVFLLISSLWQAIIQHSHRTCTLVENTFIMAGKSAIITVSVRPSSLDSRNEQAIADQLTPTNFD